MPAITDLELNKPSKDVILLQQDRKLEKRFDRCINKLLSRDTVGNIEHLRNVSGTIKVLGSRQQNKTKVKELLGKKPYKR